MTPRGFEPLLPPWKGGVLTAWPWSRIIWLKTPRVGLEPTTPRLTAVCSTIELSRIIYTDINQLSLIDSFRYCTFKISHGFPRTFYENLTHNSSTLRKASFPRVPALCYRFSYVWSSPRPISNSQLNVLLRLHLCPIYLILYKGSYYYCRDISSWGGLHA